MSTGANPLANFSGAVRLFPLPNLVLFPHGIQPLHIFEARYRQLMADALKGDRLITMALLRPGWDEASEKPPLIHPVVCIGRIMQEQRLADGRFNLLLQGLARARIMEETATNKLYRTARVEILADEEAPDPPTAGQLRKRIGAALEAWLGSHPDALQRFGQLLQSDLQTGALGDIISFALPLPLELKQQLLSDSNVTRRLRSLLTVLEARGTSSATARKFPPEFSSN